MSLHPASRLLLGGVGPRAICRRAEGCPSQVPRSTRGKEEKAPKGSPPALRVSSGREGSLGPRKKGVPRGAFVVKG